MKKTTWIWLAIAVAAIILIWYFFIRETEVETTARVMQNETQRRMTSFSPVPVKAIATDGAVLDVRAVSSSPCSSGQVLGEIIKNGVGTGDYRCVTLPSK